MNIILGILLIVGLLIVIASMVAAVAMMLPDIIEGLDEMAEWIKERKKDKGAR